MNKIYLIITIFLLSISQTNYAQQSKTDTHIFGHVICLSCDEHISFATVSLKGTTIGTTTDETGHYQLINLPEGTHTIRVQALGHIPAEKTVTLKRGASKEVNISLKN